MVLLFGEVKERATWGLLSNAFIRSDLGDEVPEGPGPLAFGLGIRRPITEHMGRQ